MTPNSNRAITVHTIDAEGRVLGRLATEIATLLRGKNKIGFTFHQDHGDRVVVQNADKIVLTGKKASQKMYYRHSSYPGGLREIPYEEMKKTHPERIIELAVRTMLPDNRLRRIWMKRLEFEGRKSNVKDSWEVFTSPKEAEAKEVEESN